MNPETWAWPLLCWSFPLIPEGDHRGAFGAIRKHDIHTGVDLYCPNDAEIFTVEGGKVVSIENFTGPNADDPSPWWNDTKAVLIKGESGVVLYGEMEPREGLEEGTVIEKGEYIGNARTVLKKYKGKPMCMLHFELYKPGTTESVWWKLDDEQPENLVDPTPKLREAYASLDKDGFQRLIKEWFDKGYNEGFYEADNGPYML